jgi:hypothetical protein
MKQWSPDEAFEAWWRHEGSGIPPLPGEDAEAHVRRICRFAWLEAADWAHGEARTALSQPEPAARIAQEAYVAFVQICKGNSDDAGTYEKDEDLVRTALKRLDELENASRSRRAPAPPAEGEELLQAYQAGRRDAEADAQQAADAAQEPPADGEVGELVAALREPGYPFPEYRAITSEQADRAADLLEKCSRIISI